MIISDPEASDETIIEKQKSEICDDCGDKMRQHSTVKNYFYCWECWGQTEPHESEIV